MSEEIRSADVVYLIYNKGAVFFDNIDIPIIGSNHGADPKLFFYQNYTNPMKRYIRKLHSSLYYHNINGFHSFFESKYVPPMRYNFVLPNGVDTTIFHPNTPNPERTDGKLRVLFIRALIENKGFDILLPIIDKFQSNDGIEFHIAGAGPLEREIIKRKKVVFHKSPKTDELAEIYRESDVFVYPSHNDTFSLVILEALASGLYVLAGDYLNGKFDDFLGTNLEYVSMKPEEFYLKILEISTNRSKIEFDKNGVYEFLKKKYDWKVISEKFYAEILSIYQTHLNKQ